MRKLKIIIAFCLLFALSGCQIISPANRNTGTEPTNKFASAPVLDTPSAKQNGRVLEIKEKMFITQINDIYLNQADYLGKTIKYEGLFTQYYSDRTDMTYYLVYRKSPGCCGSDGQAGFEVIWPDGTDITYPNENDWCEVVGTIEACNEGGENYLHIVLTSLTVLDKRGAEFVSQ